MDKWDTGRYLAEITSKDRFGNDIKSIKYFTVISSEEDDMPYDTMDFFSAMKTNCEPGEIAEILIGSAGEDVNVLFEIEHDGNIVKSEYLLRLPCH